MIEIPRLQGQLISEETLASSYCQTIRSIFFRNNVTNDTPEFTKTFPFGFLIYSNAHPEFIDYMSQDGTWEFLDTITRQKLYIFSHRPNKGEHVLQTEVNEAMHRLACAFKLGDIVLNPYFVVCDFLFKHRKGCEDWEHIYDAQIGKYHALELPTNRSIDFYDFFRTRIGRALSEISLTTVEVSPATKIANAIRNAEAKQVLITSGEGILKKHLGSFAGAIGLFKWRPGKLGRGE